jgi:hypothetical protein
MWYTCSLYDGTNDRGKLIFSKKIQIKAGKEGINHGNVEKLFVRRYRHHLRPGYLLMLDEEGCGVGFMWSYDKYWYIKYEGRAIKVERGGGFSLGEWDGWLCGIHDVTRFLQKRHAIDNLKMLRQHKTKDEGKKFKLVKVMAK